MKNIQLIATVALCFFLFGCDGESDEAKKLGFASVSEMKDIHAKGWHTVQRYDEDRAKAGGYPSVAAMKAAEEVIIKQEAAKALALKEAEDAKKKEIKEAEKKQAEVKEAERQVAQEKTAENIPQENQKSSNSKYKRTKDDIALQCHYKDPRSANSWIYVIDSDENEVNKFFKIENGKIEVTHLIKSTKLTGGYITFNIENADWSFIRNLQPGNFDPSDYEKFTVDRNSLDANNEINQKLSGKDNYYFICDLMSNENYDKLIDYIMDARAKTKAKEANNKI